MKLCSPGASSAARADSASFLRPVNVLPTSASTHGIVDVFRIAEATTAQGLPGFDNGANLQSSHGSLTAPSLKKLELRSGDQLLLQVVTAQ